MLNTQRPDLGKAYEQVALADRKATPSHVIERTAVEELKNAGHKGCAVSAVAALRTLG